MRNSQYISMRNAFVWLAAVALHGTEVCSVVEGYVPARRGEILSELVALLSIPNVAADRANIRRPANPAIRLAQLAGVDEGRAGARAHRGIL